MATAMPAEFPAVDGWPDENGIPRDSKQEYLDIESQLMKQPANKVRVVAAGLTKSAAGNLRGWLNKRDDITARTTGRKDQLERYSKQLADLGIDFTKLEKPNNFIVLARYSDADQS